jgi:phosphatidylglycerol:prolipoprotein diacylglycerol transferase
LHPTQLYEAAGLFVLFHALLWLRLRRTFDGQVVLAYGLAYPVLRFVIEWFRGDIRRGFVINGVLSTSQFISVVLFIGTLIALLLRRRQVLRQKRNASIVPALQPVQASGQDEMPQRRAA